MAAAAEGKRRDRDLGSCVGERSPRSFYMMLMERSRA
jgi:hypothetical protein